MKQLLIRLCFSAPLPFFSSLSPLYYRQPFRQEICALRGRLWTFLLQTFYAVRHTQGWETLSSKHRERILAGKEFNSIYGTYYIQAHRRFLMRCVDVSGLFFFFLFFSLSLTQPSAEAVVLHHQRGTKAPKHMLLADLILLGFFLHCNLATANQFIV